MAKLSSKFQAQANDEGTITIVKSVSLPLGTVTVGRVSATTTSGSSKQRQHLVLLHARKDNGAQEMLFRQLVVDLRNLDVEISQRLKSGSWEFTLAVNGFDPNESIEGSVNLEYQWSLFGA